MPLDSVRPHRLAEPVTAVAFDADYEHVLAMVDRCERLDFAIQEMAAESEFTSIVRSRPMTNQ